MLFNVLPSMIDIVVACTYLASRWAGPQVHLCRALPGRGCFALAGCFATRPLTPIGTHDLYCYVALGTMLAAGREAPVLTSRSRQNR